MAAESKIFSVAVSQGKAPPATRNIVYKVGPYLPKHTISSIKTRGLQGDVVYLR